MSYTRIEWKDYPKRDTPLSAENLNKMDEGIQSLYNTYLPLSGGLQHKISGTVYLENNDVSFINVNRKAGFRVFNIEDDKNWGQIMLTTDASVNDSERIVMNAYNNSKNGYQCLWMGDSDELTYFFQEGMDGTGAKTILWKVFDDGHAEVGAMGTTDLSVATKEYVDNADFVRAIDYTDTKFTLTDTATFTMLHQHIYQVGALVFIHLVFRTNAQIETTGLFTLGQLDSSILPQHVHSFTVVPANPGVSNDIRVDPGYIALDGTISFDITKTYSSSNYTFDITTFYCTDISTPITTE